MASQKPAILPATLLAILTIVALANMPANASSLTAWRGPGCNNHAERYSKCGCSGINEHGGYEFVYNGQTAALYNRPGCKGVAHTRFNSGAKGCSDFGWKSIFIQC